jgi:hypothetical protein
MKVKIFLLLVDTNNQSSDCYLWQDIYIDFNAEEQQCGQMERPQVSPEGNEPNPDIMIQSDSALFTLLSAGEKLAYHHLFINAFIPFLSYVLGLYLDVQN